MRRGIALGVLLVAGLGVVRAHAPEPLAALRWLEGRWVGSGTGPHGREVLEREIVCALQCRHLNMETRLLRTEALDADAPRGDVLSMWGWHAGWQRLVVHQFDDFAAVTTYVEQPQADPARRVLLHEDLRARTRQRLTIEFQPPDAWQERHEWAADGGAFELRAVRRYQRAPDVPAVGAGSIH